MIYRKMIRPKNASVMCRRDGIGECHVTEIGDIGGTLVGHCRDIVRTLSDIG